MIRTSPFLMPRTALLCVALAVGSCSAMERVVEVYEQTVRPLFVKHCYECHGPDSEAGEGGLRVDSIPALLKGGASGAAVQPGSPKRSLLIHAISHEPSVAAMPPESRLSSAEIAAIVSWIKLDKPLWKGSRSQLAVAVRRAPGLTDDDRQFWAFQPIRRPRVPMMPPNGGNNPVDAFVLRKLAQQGLHLSPAAGKRLLIRRAAYDLIGIPLSSEAVESFVGDLSASAFSQRVDLLLASPRYGEKWGRHWLDVARYSDSNGMDDNIAWSEAWRYRDYVIRSFNDDKPYDQFVREQIAGDFESWTSPKRADSVVATTFLMLGPKMPSADDPVKQQLDIVDEQIDTLGRVFMGLTLGCARCHAHKFDPISSRDYYAMAGIFRSTRSMLSYRVDSKFNLTALTSSRDDKRLRELEAAMDKNDDVLVNGNKVNMSGEQRKKHSAALSDAYARMRAIPTAMAVEEGDPADMPILKRGNHLTPATIVARGVPEIIAGSAPPEISAKESGRRELAAWITDRDHPLTARVMVNRIWAWHFGSGLVKSTDNFGRLGSRPENQELLDWLAAEFVESGWSIKHMHRVIMNSRTYQQSSTTTHGREKDPANRFWWQFSARRLAAEELRDSLLVLADKLDFRMGGRTLPFENHKIMSGGEIRRCDSVHSQPRRTVYLPVIRSGLNEFLKTFDFPDPSAVAGRRRSTTVPSQALFMMNSSLVNRVVESVLLKFGSERRATERLRQLHLEIFGSPLKRGEIDTWLEFVERRRKLARSSSEKDVWKSVVRVMLTSNQFMFVR